MWHVSSRSGVTTLRTAIHLLLTYLLSTTLCSRVSSSCYLSLSDNRFVARQLALYTDHYMHVSTVACWTKNALTNRYRTTLAYHRRVSIHQNLYAVICSSIERI